MHAVDDDADGGVGLLGVVDGGDGLVVRGANPHSS